MQELAPASSLGDERVTVAVPHGHTVPAVMMGDIEVTRGADLTGFEPAVGLGVSEGGRRWVAVTRGHCQQTRLEVFRVDGATVTLRGRFLFGTEVGVRWVRIDARRHDAVVSWYQSLIPVRIDCIRGPGGATLADHGPRVALVTSEGAAPPPVPELPDGARDRRRGRARRRGRRQRCGARVHPTLAVSENVVAVSGPSRSCPADTSS